MLNGVTPQLAARAVHALLHQLTPAAATRSLCILARHNPPPCLQSDIAVQQPGVMSLLQHGRYSCLSAPQQHPQLPAALQRHLNSPALLMQQAHIVQPIASLLVHRTQRQFLHTTASRATAADQGGSGEQYHQPPTAQDAAAQQQPELAVAEFSEEWINRVGLMGKVVKGPQLIHFEKHNKYKAVMVLSLFNKITGDPFVDAAKAFLVEAWGVQAVKLHRTVPLDSYIYLAGHLACDHRREAQNRLYGPALSVRADDWELISPDTIPPDRHVYEYRGEFDAAFSGSRTTTSKRSSASSTESSAGGSRRRLRAASEPSSPPDWTHTALQMLKEGQQLTAISAEVGRNQFTVWNGIMRVAGDSRDDWPPLLRVVGLTAEQGLDPCEVYDAVSEAMANNSEPLTKDGQVRLKAIREYLLAKQGRIADAIRQQELVAGDKQDGTFRQLQMLQEMRHKFGHPSQLHHPSQAD